MQIPMRFGGDRLNSILKLYFDCKTLGVCEVCEEICNYLVKMFLNPRNYSLDKVDKSSGYKDLMEYTWDKFDKVPYSFSSEVTNEFEKNVVNKIIANH